MDTDEETACLLTVHAPFWLFPTPNDDAQGQRCPKYVTNVDIKARCAEYCSHNTAVYVLPTPRVLTNLSSQTDVLVALHDI